MNGYEPARPRATMGMIAVAMAAITMGVLVVLPAKLDSVSADRYTLAAAGAATKAPVDAAIGPERIGVPEAENREAHVHPGRTTLGARDIRGKRHPLSLRSRTGF